MEKFTARKFLNFKLAKMKNFPEHLKLENIVKATHPGITDEQIARKVAEINGIWNNRITIEDTTPEGYGPSEEVN